MFTYIFATGKWASFSSLKKFPVVYCSPYGYHRTVEMIFKDMGYDSGELISIMDENHDVPRTFVVKEIKTYEVEEIEYE